MVKRCVLVSFLPRLTSLTSESSYINFFFFTPHRFRIFRLLYVMMLFKWTKKGIASLLVVILMLQTVSGFSSSGATSAILPPSKSAKYKKSVRKVPGGGDYVRLGYSGINADDKKRSELSLNQLDGLHLIGIPQGADQLGVAEKSKTVHQRSITPTGRAESRGSAEDMVKKVLHQRLHVPQAKLKLSNRLREDLRADSLDEVEVAMAMEEEFDVDIPDEDCEKLKTVGDYVRYMESRNSARSGGPSHRGPSRPSFKLRAAGTKLPQGKRLGNLGAGRMMGYPVRQGYSRPMPISRYQLYQ